MRFIFIIISSTLMISACREEKRLPPYITGMEGKPIPNFVIQLSDSITYIPSTSIPIKKSLVLFYFDPNCPYCRAQMRDILNNNTLIREHSLCLISSSDLKAIKKFADYFKLERFPDIIFGRDPEMALAKLYSIVGVPFIAVFDKNKILKNAYSGRMDKQSLFSIQ